MRDEQAEVDAYLALASDAANSVDARQRRAVDATIARASAALLDARRRVDALEASVGHVAGGEWGWAQLAAALAVANRDLAGAKLARPVNASADLALEVAVRRAVLAQERLGRALESVARAITRLADVRS